MVSQSTCKLSGGAHNAGLPRLVEVMQLASADTDIEPNIVLVCQVWSLASWTQIERVGVVVFHTHGHSDLPGGVVPVVNLPWCLWARLPVGADHAGAQPVLGPGCGLFSGRHVQLSLTAGSSHRILKILFHTLKSLSTFASSFFNS